MDEEAIPTASRSESETVALVTGATDGIGRATALRLASRGVSVVVHGRDPRRVDDTLGRVRASGGGPSSRGEVADFASLSQVRELAGRIASGGDPPAGSPGSAPGDPGAPAGAALHVLVNNAGTYEPSLVLTEDGIERTFQVDHLAPFLLTHLLLETLLRSAPARIVTVTSVVHRSALIDLSGVRGTGRYDPYQAYALSKFGNVVMTYDLAQRLRGTGVTANCMHPGGVATKLLRAGFSRAGGIPPERAAEDVVRLALDPDLEGASGRYFERGRETTSAPETYDLDVRRSFRHLSEELTGIAPRAGEPVAAGHRG